MGHFKVQTCNSVFLVLAADSIHATTVLKPLSASGPLKVPALADPFQSTAWVDCFTAIDEFTFFSIFLWIVQRLYRLNWEAVYGCLRCARKELEAPYSTN